MAYDNVESCRVNLYEALERGGPDLLKRAKKELDAFPGDGELLHLVSLAALLDGDPDEFLRYQKRLEKQFQIVAVDHILRVVGLAQKKYWSAAIQLRKKYGLESHRASHFFYRKPNLSTWLAKWLKAIDQEELRKSKPARTFQANPTSRRQNKTISASKPVQKQAFEPKPEVLSKLPELPRFSSEIPLRFDLLELDSLSIPPAINTPNGMMWFRLMGELNQLSLMQGFDELLCLPYLQQVDTYWYQVETVRKVLKQFRGRVLLADEVGLGKTIEAGMVLKEFLLRGMVERVLILTPATLVGQWQEEMETKFGIVCSTSYDPLARQDSQAFWNQKRVIASIATARRKEHFDILVQQNFDIVIVDEAHHLKNRATQNWKLVDALKKRFLILLSATPIQNSLVELYNLLTLLKPGIFKTEKEFRSAYMTPRKPRIPANRDQLRDLMREVMIRNTRSLVDVRLPPRQAITVRLDANEDERVCYDRLNQLIRDIHQTGERKHHLSLHHLLSAAGSSPEAAIGAVERFLAKNKRGDAGWLQLLKKYRAVVRGTKETALLELLKRNPEEKKMVFVHHRDTLKRLDEALTDLGLSFVRFDGTMNGTQKDAAIIEFRETVPVLLCTESGGEGRNIQFCNTMINFDMPWNPMVIEQRIGRIHRIGQTREVFIFNLVVRDTVEDHLLKILDEKINMFELVVGEVDAILGEIDDQRDFSEMIFSAWVETTQQGRVKALDDLGEQMLKAKHHYEEVKVLDENLFGQEFETG